MDKSTSCDAHLRAKILSGNKSSGSWTQTNRSFLSIEGQTAMEYNMRMSKIKEQVQFKPELVWSPRVRQ